VPARVDGDVKEGLCKLVDDAVASDWPHARACATLDVADVRVHRWRARLREHGTLVDRAPGGNPMHRLLAWEEDAILELIEDWGPVDRSHRKLAHRGRYTGKVLCRRRRCYAWPQSTRSAYPASRGPRRRCRLCRGNATASGSGTRRISRAPGGLRTPLWMWSPAPRSAICSPPR
jgi:hypothetical protein